MQYNKLSRVSKPSETNFTAQRIADQINTINIWRCLAELNSPGKLRDKSFLIPSK